MQAHAALAHVPVSYFTWCLFISENILAFIVIFTFPGDLGNPVLTNA